MKRAHGQMSESLLLGALLAMAGGFLTHIPISAAARCLLTRRPQYCPVRREYCRGQLAAGSRIFPADSGVRTGRCGGGDCQTAVQKTQSDINIHWRQIVVLVEIVLLIAAAFLPQSMNTTVNIMISFICAMQVESFRKVRGSAFATTMCTGNLRSGTEQLVIWAQTGDRNAIRKNAQLLLNHPVFYPRRCDWRTGDRENWRKSAAADLYPAESGLCSHVCRGRTYARGGGDRRKGTVNHVDQTDRRRYGRHAAVQPQAAAQGLFSAGAHTEKDWCTLRTCIRTAVLQPVRAVR